MEHEIVEDAGAVAARAAALLLEAIEREPGMVRVALSGGSTPQRLYALLATPAWSTRIPWKRVHWFWGDERFVPPEHPDSNYGVACRLLFDQVPVPRGNLHPMPTVGCTPQRAAQRYEETLRSFMTGLAPDAPLWNVNLLGMGEDGHTASLFPGGDALEERKRWVCAVIGAKPEARLTLTYPALNAASLALLLAAGAGKRSCFERWLAGADLPVARLRVQGRLLCLVDRAAAPPAWAPTG